MPTGLALQLSLSEAIGRERAAESIGVDAARNAPLILEETATGARFFLMLGNLHEVREPPVGACILMHP